MQCVSSSLLKNSRFDWRSHIATLVVSRRWHQHKTIARRRASTSHQGIVAGIDGLDLPYGAGDAWLDMSTKKTRPFLKLTFPIGTASMQWTSMISTLLPLLLVVTATKAMATHLSISRWCYWLLMDWTVLIEILLASDGSVGQMLRD